MLRHQPICAGWPEPGNCDQLATEDDHIVPWSQRGDMTFKQWDAPDNHQGLCHDHHTAKTQAESRPER